MNKTTYKKIASPDFIEALKRFKSLQIKNQVTLSPGLSEIFKSCLAIIEAMRVGCETYEEIVKYTELSLNTVKQIIRALEEGGLKIYRAYPLASNRGSIPQKVSLTLSS